MKDRYQAVIIGGGVVGVSVLYHLAKNGWTDCVVLERSVLAAGSSWHAAGGVHALNADPNMSALQGYTLDLLSKIQEESGQDIGLHMTGGITIASTPDRWEWLQSAYRTYQTIGIEDVSLMTPDEVKDKCPIMDVKGVLGGLWADNRSLLFNLRMFFMCNCIILYQEIMLILLFIDCIIYIFLVKTFDKIIYNLMRSVHRCRVTPI